MIEWAKKAPPKPPRKHMGLPTVYLEFRDALLERPGRWAKWPALLHSPKSANDVAYQVNTNRRPTFPADDFEARVDGLYEVWVRARPKRKKP